MSAKLRDLFAVSLACHVYKSNIDKIQKINVARADDSHTRKVVGVGISCNDEIHCHASNETKPVLISKDEYINLITTLSKDSHVIVFTNGNDADNQTFEELKSELSCRNDPNIKFSDRPRTPTALAELIAGFDVVISHRLHANIIGYSLGKKVISFVWDKKLDSFFKNIRAEYFLKSSFDIDELTSDVLESKTVESKRDVVCDAQSSLDSLINMVVEEVKI